MSHQIQKNLGVTHHGVTTQFRLWAPFAQKVILLRGTDFDWQETEMANDDKGYWTARLKHVDIGQKYKYRIITQDGRELYRNDPRARQITDSDNGSSVIVGDIQNEDTAFISAPTEQQIIYELHVGTFNRPDPATPGTFYDAIAKLDYLAELGINTVELMPITSMANSNGWGYSVSHVYSVEGSYGGRHGLLEFVRACHERGIAVILDVVYNHFYGDALWQFDGWSENGRGGIYFYNDERGDTPWGARPDYGRPEVRQFILDNVTMWLTEYHLDGLRVDSTIYMRNTEGVDNNPPHDIPDAWSLLGEITTLAHKIRPDALMIAEDCANSAYLTKPTSEQGCAFDAQWELGFPHALRDALGLRGNPTLAGVRYELERSYNGNAFEKVVFSDSHDTAANGSVRLNEAAGNHDAADIFAREKSLLADAITLTAPGVPMLLQGQEFMQEGAFNDWKELEWDKAEMYAGIVLAHRHLIDLRLNRHGNTAGLLGQNTTIFHQDDDNAVMGYQRWSWGGPGDDTLVIVNFSNRTHDVYQLHLPVAGKWHVRFNSSWKGYSPDFHEVAVDMVKTDRHQTATLKLPPYGVLILSQEK